MTAFLYQRSSIDIAPKRATRMPVLSDQISVACEQPAPVFLFPKNRQRVAGAVHWRTVFRRNGHIDVVPQVRPIAEDLQLLNVASSFESHVHHSTGGGRERLLAERFLTGNHEDHVVGHEAQHSFDVALLCRGHPRVDQVPYRVFIFGHENSLRSDAAQVYFAVSPRPQSVPGHFAYLRANAPLITTFGRVSS